MANALFTGLFKLIKTIVDVLLMPLNVVFAALLPDVTSVINNFNNAVTTLVGSNLSYFSSMLPPITRATILFYFLVLIGYYGASFTIHIIMKVFIIIKKIKIW